MVIVGGFERLSCNHNTLTHSFNKSRKAKSIAALLKLKLAIFATLR